MKLFFRFLFIICTVSPVFGVVASEKATSLLDVSPAKTKSLVSQEVIDQSSQSIGSKLSEYSSDNVLSDALKDAADFPIFSDSESAANQELDPSSSVLTGIFAENENNIDLDSLAGVASQEQRSSSLGSDHSETGEQGDMSVPHSETGEQGDMSVPHSETGEQGGGGVPHFEIEEQFMPSAHISTEDTLQEDNSQSGDHGFDSSQEKGRKSIEAANLKKPMSDLISMDFSDVDIDSFFRFLGEVSGFNIVKDPSLTGSISLTTFGETTIEQSLNLLNSVLSLKGFTLIRMENILKIVPLDDIVRTNVDVFKEYNVDKKPPNDDRVITKMISLQYAKAKNVVAAIEPLIGKFGSVIPYDRTNVVIITDSSANIARLTYLIDDLDRQVTSLVTRSYVIEYANILELRNLLEKLTKQYEKELGHFEINVDQRTKSLFVTTLPDNFEIIEKFIFQLDKGVTQILLSIDIIRLPYKEGQSEIQNYLFPKVIRGKSGKEINNDEHLFNWRCGLKDKVNKIFSWYGFSEGKTKKDFLYQLNVLYGPDHFDVSSLPMMTLSDSCAAEILLGKEKIFQSVKGMDVFFKLIPHFEDKEDDVLTFEIFQKISGFFYKKPQEAYARFILNNDQTVVLGGLRNIKCDSVSEKKETGSKNPIDPLIKDEFLIFLTPHLLRDSKTFKKKEQKTLLNKKKTKKVKPDLGLLFPGGFMQTAPQTIKEEVEVQEQKISSNKKKGFVTPAEHFLNGPPVFKDSHKIWWKMQDLVQVHASNVSVNEPDSFVGSKQKNSYNFLCKDVSLSFNKEQREKKQKKKLDKKSSSDSVTKKEIEHKEKEMLSFSPEESTPLSDIQSSDVDKENYVLKETLYRRGILFYKKRQYKGAIREFSPIITIDPHYKNVQRYMELAQKFYKQQLYQKKRLRTEEKELFQEKIKKLVEIPLSMDQKAEQVLRQERKEEYTQTEKLFEEDIGNPTENPEDRIVSANHERISGEILEVSQQSPLVVLNVGELYNVHPGMIFKVYRDNDLIGKVSVTDVGERVSGAKIISKKTAAIQFQFGDTVIQAIEQM